MDKKSHHCIALQKCRTVDEGLSFAVEEKKILKKCRNEKTEAQTFYVHQVKLFHKKVCHRIHGMARGLENIRHTWYFILIL